MWRTVLRRFSRESVLGLPSTHLPSSLRLESLGDYIAFFEAEKLSLVDAKTKNSSIKSPGNGYKFIFQLNSTSDHLKLENCLKAIQESGVKSLSMDDIVTPEIPRTIKDLEEIGQTCLFTNPDLDSNHPGFNDLSYRNRRHQIAEIALKYKLSDREVPFVEYNEQETEIWYTIFKDLKPELEKHACQEYLDRLGDILRNCDFSEDRIPQMSDINRYLQKRTKFQLMPVAGLLSTRDFLAHLAFRVFPSTQYVRHYSELYRSPENDVVHELIGHTPLLANPLIADLCQHIGLASLGVSDEEVKKLSNCYLSTLKYGILLNSKKERKAFGARVLTSSNEIQHAMDHQTNVKKFDPKVTCERESSTDTLQPFYWYSSSIDDAKMKMIEFTESMDRAFTVSYDKNEIGVSQKVSVLVTE